MGDLSHAYWRSIDQLNSLRTFQLIKSGSLRALRVMETYFAQTISPAGGPGDFKISQFDLCQEDKMGQRDAPIDVNPSDQASDETGSSATDGAGDGEKRGGARPSLRQALNALMMSDERRKQGKPGEITLEMDKDRSSQTRSRSARKTEQADKTQEIETDKTHEIQGVQKMSGTGSNDANHPGSSEPMRIGRRGGPASSEAPVTLEAEPIMAAPDMSSKQTQMVRGQQSIKRSGFYQEPVVAWLVVIGGPGLGAYRPIFEGNNTLGRADSQRIPINFGDESISSEEQVYIRYDSSDKNFLLVPNLTKTNVVAVNDEKPTAAVLVRYVEQANPDGARSAVDQAIGVLPGTRGCMAGGYWWARTWRLPTNIRGQ